jgi:hypothetical protein
MLLVMVLFSVGLVNAEEVVAEEENARVYEEEIVMQTEDGVYDLNENFDRAMDEEAGNFIVEQGEFYLDTLFIAFDNVTYVRNGVLVNNENASLMIYDADVYQSYYKLIDFSFAEDTNDDGNLDYIYSLIVNKDGTGRFYKGDILNAKLVATELTMTFDVEITGNTQFPPLDNEAIESWIANALENHLSWLLVVLGVSASALAGIIWGLVKLIFYIKGLQLLTGKQNTQTSELLKEVSGLKSQVSTMNKANKLSEYAASALNDIVEKSNKTDKERLRREYLKALQDKEVSEELREQETQKINEVEKKEKQHEAQVKRSIDKIKENINKG